MGCARDRAGAPACGRTALGPAPPQRGAAEGHGVFLNHVAVCRDAWNTLQKLLLRRGPLRKAVCSASRGLGSETEPFGKEARTGVSSPAPARHPRSTAASFSAGDRAPAPWSSSVTNSDASEWPPGFNPVRSVNSLLLKTGVVHTPSSREIILKSQKVGFQPRQTPSRVTAVEMRVLVIFPVLVTTGCTAIRVCVAPTGGRGLSCGLSA